MSEHLAPEHAAGIASLREDDPERRAAEEHAAACPGCRALLARGAAVLALLDALPHPAPPDPALLARVRAAVHADLASEGAPQHGGHGGTAADTGGELARGPSAGRTLLDRALPPSLAVAGAAVLIAFAHQLHDEPTSIAVAVAGLAAAVAAMLIARSGRAGLATLVAVGTSLGLLALPSADPLRLPALAPGCSGLELAVAAVPFAAVAWLARRAGRALPGWEAAALAASGALAGQSALVLVCPDSPERAHVAVFHVGVVAVAALLGALVAQLPALRTSR